MQTKFYEVVLQIQKLIRIPVLTIFAKDNFYIDIEAFCNYDFVKATHYLIYEALNIVSCTDNEWSFE